MYIFTWCLDTSIYVGGNIMSDKIYPNWKMKCVIDQHEYDDGWCVICGEPKVPRENQCIECGEDKGEYEFVCGSCRMQL